MKQITGNIVMFCPMCETVHSVGITQQKLLNRYGDECSIGRYFYCGQTKKTYQTKEQGRLCREFGIIPESEYKNAVRKRSIV